MIVTIKKCALAKPGESEKKLQARQIATELFARTEYVPRIIHGRTVGRGATECIVEVTPKKCPDEESECKLSRQDQKSLAQVLESRGIEGSASLIDEDNGFIPFWTSKGKEGTGLANAASKSKVQKATNSVVEESSQSSSFPIIIIALLLAILILGVIGVICVKHKSGEGGGKSEPAHVEMEVI